MTSGAFLLYIDDNTLGPALELMRRTSQPESRSLPHVTVRYAPALPEDPEFYTSKPIDSIYVAEPGSFDNYAFAQDSLSTVFLRCESETLEQLSYKPDYPDSVFHVTIYDGPPSSLAAGVFKLLSTFDWHLPFSLPKSRLTLKAVGSKSQVSHDRIPSLSQPARALFLMLRGTELDPLQLLQFTDPQRLELIEEICEYIHKKGESNARLDSKKSAAQLPSKARPIQDALWGSTEMPAEMNSTGKTSRRSRRQKNGLYLTPPELAFDIVAATVPHITEGASIRFTDPAIGGGIFYASLRRFVEPLRIESACGVEADAKRANITAHRWRQTNLRVVTGDYVETALNSSNDNGDTDLKCSLLITNPPYVRFQRLDGEVTRRWRNNIERSLNIPVDPRSDLYVYFILSSHRHLEDGAISAWLVPSEFMVTNYGQSLRRYLSTTVELLHLHSYQNDTSLFHGAKISSTIIIFRNRRPPLGGIISITSGGTAANPVNERRIPWTALTAMDRWSFMATPPRFSDAPRIGDLFTVRRGIATGANSRFVLTKETVDRLTPDPRWIKPVLPKARHLPATRSKQSQDKPDVEAPQLWLIDTDTPMEEIELASPAFAEYLRSIEREVGDRTLLRRRQPFYKQENIGAPHYVFSYMARSAGADQARFRSNRGGAVILNNYLGLYPRPFVREWFDRDPANDDVLLEALNRITDEDFRAGGRIYAAGLNKVEVTELRRFFVPDLPSRLLSAVQSVRAAELEI